MPSQTFKVGDVVRASKEGLGQVYLSDYDVPDDPTPILRVEPLEAGLVSDLYASANDGYAYYITAAYGEEIYLTSNLLTLVASAPKPGETVVLDPQDKLEALLIERVIQYRHVRDAAAASVLESF